MPIKIKLVTPQKVLMETEADLVVVPGAAGEMGFEEGHIPLLSGLQVGEIRIHSVGKLEHLATSGGFVEARPDSVVILAETAEPADEIDVERAQAARSRAQERLARPTKETDIERAQAALSRALNRLRIAEHR
ncbi:MAG: ATP synthase F0F1 subunit epsilon [Planctomycetes bacterium DG_23]|nr:MAG: ATP synthase F0F1 subunit epsilon [Planctomycetes bacterium DG_23]